MVTRTEHAGHVCDIYSLEVFQTDECFQIAHASEPVSCTRNGSTVGEGLVEHNRMDII